MSDEILTENQANQTTNTQDANANKPPVEASSDDKSMFAKMEVMVEEAVGAVGEVFEALKDEIVEHLGSSDHKDDEHQDAAPQANSDHDNAATSPAHDGEAHIASGDLEPAAAEHPGGSATDAPAIDATPVANLASEQDAVEPLVASAETPSSTELTAEQAEQPATPAAAAGHQDGHQPNEHGGVVVETVVGQETIVREADGTEHVQIVEVHEVATVVEGENGEAEVYAVGEYAVASGDIQDGEVYDASADHVAGSDEVSDDYAVYGETANDVADYDTAPDYDAAPDVHAVADNADYQNAPDAHDVLETHLSDHVSYED